MTADVDTRDEGDWENRVVLGVFRVECESVRANCENVDGAEERF